MSASKAAGHSHFTSPTIDTMTPTTANANESTPTAVQADWLRRPSDETVQSKKSPTASAARTSDAIAYGCCEDNSGIGVSSIASVVCSAASESSV